LDDPYFKSGFNKDYETITLSIQYPQISSKYQGLIPLIKKFIREDLLRAESPLNPTKLIKSIEIVPWKQNGLLAYAIVSNSTYQSIIDKGDEEAEAKYIDDLQDELIKSEERLNKLLRDHCDLDTTIILNCRTKAEQFSIVAKKRVKEIVHQIGTLKNLTNSQYYDSNSKSWQKIQRQLIDSVYDLDRYVKLYSGRKKEEAILERERMRGKILTHEKMNQLFGSNNDLDSMYEDEVIDIVDDDGTVKEIKVYSSDKKN